MTKGLGLFLAFYILVGQPALLGRMLDNCSLYQLAGLNAGVFFIAWIISAIYKSGKNKGASESNESKVKLTGKSEEKISRIEGDDGVAIVEVQKKEEIVVEANNDEIQNDDTEALPQNAEEKEEKPEEKISERPMREPVSIPKIVQPITGHQTPKKKKNIKWGQRIVLLITLGLSVVIAWSLWEFLEKRGIAIALLLGWILYLVIGKLFDIDGFYNAKKLFTNWLYIILILGGIGYGAYSAYQQDKSILPSDFAKEAVIHIKNRFNSEDDEVNTGNLIYIFEGTGEVIQNTTDAEFVTGDIEMENDYSSGDDNSELETNIQPEDTMEEQVSAISPEDAKKQVTMGEAIKSLLSEATLSTKTNKTFTYVSKSDELYPYFKTAQEKWMIGTDTDPSKIVSCETYVTMKGIREGRDVGNYIKDNIKAVYWDKAVELGKLNGCKKGAYVTRGNL